MGQEMGYNLSASARAVACIFNFFPEKKKPGEIPAPKTTQSKRSMGQLR
jgi:hypothetical protein